MTYRPAHLKERFAKIDKARKAFNITPCLETKKQLAQCLWQLAVACTQGDMRRSDKGLQADACAESAKLFQELGDNYNCAQALNSGAVALGFLGKYEDALKSAVEAKNILAPCFSYISIGRHSCESRRARRLFKGESSPICSSPLTGEDVGGGEKIVIPAFCQRESSIPSSQIILTCVKNLFYCMLSAHKLEKNSEALEFSKEGAQLCGNLAKEHSEVMRYFGLFLRGAGIILIDSGKPKQALIGLSKAYKLFSKSSHSDSSPLTGEGMGGGSGSGKFRSNRDIAVTCREMGRAYFRIGNLKKSKEYIEKAVSLAGKESAPIWEHYYIAKCFLPAGKKKAALAELKKGIENIEALRGFIPEEDNRARSFGAFLPVYDMAVKCCMEMHDLEGAYAIVQQAKARTFLETIVGKDKKQDCDIPLTANPAGLSQIKLCLKQDEAVVEYYPAKDILWIFVVRSRSLFVKRSAVDLKKLSLMADCWHGFIEKGSSAKESAVNWYLSVLYEHLIKPIEDSISGCRHLRIIPSRELFGLPFSALINSKGKFLIEDYEISYLPFASFLCVSRSPSSPLLARGCACPLARDAARGTQPGTGEDLGGGEKSSSSFLALANPEGDLIFAEKEAKQAGRLFRNSKVFTRSKACKTALSRMKKMPEYLHLACHGEFFKDKPSESCLRLSSGCLTVDDVFKLNLSGNELTFLSGCHTGRSRISAGDEIIGFVRAFLSAGSKSAVVSLWDVEDAAAQKLVVEFYRHLASGSNKAQSLRSAQIELLETSPHPYLWAAFQLYGG